MTATRSMPNLGTQQSPIDLVDPFKADIRVSIAWDALVLSPKDKDGKPLDKYKPTRKLIAAPKRKTGHIKMDKDRYVPVDLHWHFPAEHHFKGTVHPAEVHIVHVREDHVPFALQGKLDWCRIAVLGVFLKLDKLGKKSYKPIEVASFEGEGGVVLERSAILPAKPSAIRYNGSLTTPPYSENVTFVLFEATMPALEAQLSELDRNTGEKLPNARELQDINRRCCLRGDVVTKGKPKSKA